MRSLIKYGLYILLSLSLIGLNGLLIAQVWIYREGGQGRMEQPDGSSPAVMTRSAYQENDTASSVLSLPQRKPASMIKIAPLRQHPELYNGCEITALTMVLNDYGIAKDKQSFAAELQYDPTPLKMDQNGRIISWGDPDKGFVGDITGKKKGLGVNHGPLLELMKTYIPTAQNLTQEPYENLERYVSGGVPVIVWTTVSFTTPSEDQWFKWSSPTGGVQATFQMHTVVMVGYDEEYVYVNDPQTGEQAKKIKKAAFISTWEAMGKQALSYLPV